MSKEFKEVNSSHDMIDIGSVRVIDIVIGKPAVRFFLDNDLIVLSDTFDTIEEAIKFRNEIMGVE